MLVSRRVRHLQHFKPQNLFQEFPFFRKLVASWSGVMGTGCFFNDLGIWASRVSTIYMLVLLLCCFRFPWCKTESLSNPILIPLKTDLWNGKTRKKNIPILSLPEPLNNQCHLEFQAAQLHLDKQCSHLQSHYISHKFQNNRASPLTGHSHKNQGLVLPDSWILKDLQERSLHHHKRYSLENTQPMGFDRYIRMAMHKSMPKVQTIPHCLRTN